MPTASRRRISLVRLQLGTVALVTAVALGFTVAHTLDTVADGALGAEQHRAQDLARLASTLLDGPHHAALLRTAGGKDAFLSWSTAPEGVRDEHLALADFAATMGLDAPVRVLRLSPTFHREVVAQPDQSQPDGVELTFTSAGTPTWRHPEPYRPAMAAALLTGRPGVSPALPQPAGSIIEGYAPIFDEYSGVVGIVAVSIPAPPSSWGLLQAQPGLLLSPLLALLGVVFALAVTLLWARPGLRRLEDAAARLVDGNGPPLEPIAPVLELHQIAQDIVDAAQSGKAASPPLPTPTTFTDTTSQGERVEPPLTVEDRPVEAPPANDLPVKPPSLTVPPPPPSPAERRQARIAALEPQLRIGLGLGDWRRPARLVDLHGDRAILAIVPELDPALAPGMPACLAIGTPVGPPYVVLRGTHHRTQITSDPQTGLREHLLTFTVPTPVPRGRLPAMLQRAVDSREEPRLLPPTHRATLRPDRTSRSVPAQVVNISASGLQLTVALPLAELSRWGREVEVAVQLFPGRTVHRRKVRVQSCHRVPPDRTALCLRLVPAGPEATAAWLADVTRIAEPSTLARAAR